MSNGYTTRRKPAGTGLRQSRRQLLDYNRDRYDSAKRDAITTTGDSRRAQVYRTDVPFAGVDRVRDRWGLPTSGRDRDQLAARITLLRLQGHSYPAVAAEVGFPPEAVTYFTYRYKLAGGGTMNVYVQDPSLGSDADSGVAELGFVIKGTRRAFTIPLDEALAEEVHSMLGVHLDSIRQGRREKQAAQRAARTPIAQDPVAACEPRVSEGRAGYGFRRRTSR